jgi:hypothetical protein
MQLTITNTSTRKIAEVHAYLGRLLVGTRFWGIERDPITPGGSATLQYTFEPAPYDIRIAAVVFEDGTGEGDQRVLQNAFSFSKAFRQELRRNVDILSDFIKRKELFPSSIGREEFAQLREQMAAEPASPAAENEETDAFYLEGRRAAHNWIRMPVKGWESLAQASDSSHTDAAVNLQHVMSRFIDRCLTLDKRLADRTDRKSVR